MNSDHGARQLGREGAAEVAAGDLSDLLFGLRAARDGAVRLTADGNPVLAEIAEGFNGLLERNDKMSRELVRVGKVIGREDA
jgi:hypothetical protein